MHTGKGQILELILEDGVRHLRVACPAGLIPSPGQYLFAGDESDAALPVPLFHTDSASQGFIAAAPVPDFWNPGTELSLHGPLGRGFTLPLSAHKVGVVAFDEAPARLKGLVRQALKQDAAVVLVCNSNPDNVPDDVEVQPLSALRDILEWADYVAFEVARENLSQLKEQLSDKNPLLVAKARLTLIQKNAQVLIRTPIPCGGLADCGVCAVTLKTDWKLACKDGPVFDWRELE